MAISAVDVIGPAFQHMKQQLFERFRLGQWLRLALVGLLAGEMGSGGGFTGFNVPFRPPTSGTSHFQEVGFDLPTMFGLAGMGVLIVIGVVVAVVIGLIFLYISSMMRFVLFDSVLNRNCEVRKFWRQRREPGFRYFIWQLLLSLAAAVTIVLVFGIPAGLAFLNGWFNAPRDHVAPLVILGIGAVLGFFSLIVVLLLIQILVKDFVVPQMALDGVTVGQGWRRLVAMMKAEKKGFLGYIAMKFVLAIGVGVVLGMIALVVILVLLIPFGGVSALAILGGGAAGWTWNPLTIGLVVIAGAIALAVCIGVAAMIAVPSVVFFPAYSIHFFAGRYPALAGVLSRPPVEAT